MSKLMIEDVQVGVTAGGMACAPIAGYVVVEARIRNTDDETVSFYSLAEVDGTLSFYETPESTYAAQLDEDFEIEEALMKALTGGFTDYNEYFEAVNEGNGVPVETALLWRYLVYMVRADWKEVARMKEDSVGKCLGDFEIPVCDVEQTYLDEMEDDEEDE